MRHGLVVVMPEWLDLVSGPPLALTGKTPLGGSIGQAPRPLQSGTAISKGPFALESEPRQLSSRRPPRRRSRGRNGRSRGKNANALVERWRWIRGWTSVNTRTRFRYGGRADHSRLGGLLQIDRGTMSLGKGLDEAWPAPYANYGLARASFGEECFRRGM